MSRCKFHPLTPASGRCAQCEVNYCAACSDESAVRRSSRMDYLCFVCSAPLDSITSDSSIPPFWRNLGDVYKYPLAGSAIAAVIVTSLLAALLMDFGLLKIFPAIAIVLYCFACLRETALAKFTAPEFEKCFEGSIGPIFFVVLIYVGAIILTSLAFNYVGLVFGILFTAFVVLCLPAAIMVIAIEEKLFPALNPARLISVVASAGSSYFVMLLFLVIMSSSVGMLATLFSDQGPTFISVFFESLISSYYLIVSFHILGYLVYQTQYLLGFGAANQDLVSEFRSDQKWLNAKIETLIKAGDFAAAIKSSKRQVSEPNAVMWHWARCFKLTCAGTSVAELSAFVPAYFDKLESSQQHDALAEAYLQVKARIPEFRIDNDARCLRIAQSLFDIGRYDFVVQMLQDFHTRGEQADHINQSLRMVSESYKKIPGKEKNAKFFQDLYKIRNSPA